MQAFFCYTSKNINTLFSFIYHTNLSNFISSYNENMLCMFKNETIEFN